MARTSRNGILTTIDTGIFWKYGDEQLRVDAWGNDTLRVRATIMPKFEDNLWALECDLLKSISGHVMGDQATIDNGRIRATINRQGTLSFTDLNDDQRILLHEVESPRAYADYGRQYVRKEGERFSGSAHFTSDEDERLYGLGQHQHGFLNQKGTIVNLDQKNSEVAVPFLVSSKGYGVLWNNPARGRVELQRNRTSWIADRTTQIDYLVFAGNTVAEILKRYTEATGRSPRMPEHASGFWQCKLRYETQEELLSVVREHKRRGLPMSVVVIDFFHWTKMGEWRFDADAWPDPKAMISELSDYGIELMVSIWPSVSPDSEHFEHMRENGMLLSTERGIPVFYDFTDTKTTGVVYMHHYDPSDESAQDFIWTCIKQNYYELGIHSFWLDACEPQLHPNHTDNARMKLGNMEEVGCIYPMLHQKAFYERMRSEGQKDVLNLCRSAWAGSQRYGAAVWSGDIDSTFDALRRQVPAGLNMALSGLPWWTTDIGGFFGGNTQDPVFRELIIRWFQYGLFCPIFRLHGFRDSWDRKHGGPNEVWSFGNDAYEIIRQLLLIRERLRPYIMEQMEIAHQTGTPPMRPLFFDFPEDSNASEIEDQFMLGPDILVAPVLHQGQTSRTLYLPDGVIWNSAWDRSETHHGGSSINVDAPLHTIPVYVRDGAKISLQ